jgi:hypothetical protein
MYALDRRGAANLLGASVAKMTLKEKEDVDAD